MIRVFQGKIPQVHEGVFLAATSDVIGNVMIGKDSSVWYGTVLRGDESPITIGERSNIQDLTVIHGHPEIPTIIKDGVSIGHRVTVHSATIQDNCIIGMGATLPTGSEIGKNCIIGAGALILEKQHIPAGSLAVGAPAKVVRTLEANDIEKIRENARNYLILARKHAQEKPL